MKTWTLLAMLALVTISCSQDADRAPGQDSAGGTDLATVDSAPYLDLDAQVKLDACLPGCHWDCFTTVKRCYLGKVWSFQRGPVPCCQYSDPWPHGPGPGCTSGNALYTCKDAKCQDMDTRYDHCINPKSPNSPTASVKDDAHLFKLFCPAEARLSKVGDGCTTDADCRPMHASVKGRLTCDTAAGKCKEVARPASPSNLGKTCGIKATSTSQYMTSDTGFVDPKTGAVCHMIWDKTNKCLAQGVTLACKYDEDCPTGMACVCVLGNMNPLVQGTAQVCAVVTSRDTVAGRTAGLKCH